MAESRDLSHTSISTRGDRSGPKDEEHYRPPLLNGLIVVTLMTIIVALVYLGNYYLGENGRQKVMWYPLNFSCSSMGEHCSATVGVGEWVGLQLHDDGHGGIVAQADSHVQGSPRYAFNLKRLSPGPVHVVDGVKSIGPQSAYLETLSDYCLNHSGNWRIEVIVTTASRSVGTWRDLRLPCLRA